MPIISQSFIIKIVLSLLKSVSPIFLSEIRDVIIRLRSAAKKSSNPWDDILVDWLESFFAGFGK